MKSKFRKIFWIRLALGFCLFISLSIFFISGLLRFEIKNLLPLIIAAVVLMFLSYLSLDLPDIFTITITENAIEKMNVFTKLKKSIPFSAITTVEKEKVRFRNVRGHITDGHYITIIKSANDDLIISPDSFENYEDLRITILEKLKK